MNSISNIKKYLKNKFPSLIYIYRSLSEVTHLYNAYLYSSYAKRIDSHPNTFCKFGNKVYSQSDEDGLTIEIIKRLDIKNGSFLELGVGAGVENNTLILLALGWNGYWIGGEDILIKNYSAKRFNFIKSWITLNNINSLITNNPLYTSEVDLLSIDLDGNDIYFLQEILKKSINPKIIIAEYNSKFPPPVEFSIKYNEGHLWSRSDYQGSSLQSIVNALAKFGYKLICCNAATGVNAFFVRNEFFHLFPEVPDSINDIYATPFHLFYSGNTWPSDIKTIESFIN